MAYVLPQTLVYQDFNIQPAVVENPLAAHISGGNAYLVRYAEADEKVLGYLGLYDNMADAILSWPNKPTGSKIDSSYTKLFIENALLRYFNVTIGGGSDITVATGYRNRISSAAVNFASNSAAAHSSSLLDRGVKVGDVVKVRGVPTGPDATGDAVTNWSYIKSLIADVEDGVVGTASVDSSNAATQSLSVSVSQTAGAENCITTTASASGYNGLADGETSETYLVRVTESSVNGDHTTAKLRVISGSGTDDSAEVIPSAAGVATSIGSRGLTVTFDTDSGSGCSASADNESVSADDLIEGQEFTVTVNQAFTKTTATAGGDFDGDTDTTYIITVTKGGLFAALPEITVSTTNGYDQSGPHVVTSTGVDITIGTKSVAIQFGASLGLCKGDRFYISCTGTTDGPIRTIELGHNLDSNYAAGDDLSVELFIRKPYIEVTANRTDAAPLTNWEQSDTEVIVNSGITAFDSTWTDDGELVALDVFSSSELSYGKVYVEYRAWVIDLINSITGISSTSDLDVIPGALSVDNPLKWGVYMALANNNSRNIYFTAVADPSDVDSWQDVIDILDTRDDIYNLVPLTRQADVLALFQAHVLNSSGPSEGLWRVLWVNLQAVPEQAVIPVTTEILAVFEDDVETSGSQYTICRVPAGTSEFISNGVAAGDIVRALYTSDGFGNETYSEFVVEEVQAEDQLRLKTGPSAPQSVPAKIEIWRNLNASQEITAIGAQAGAYGNRRIRAVWPDTIDAAGTTMPGYFLCGALAALSSSVLPQQGLTNLSLTGFSAVPNTTRFKKSQLDTLAESGVWIVTQNQNGVIYTRHALTTGDYADINAREESVVRNVDSIAYRFKDYFAPFIGVTNVTPSMRDIILGGAKKLIRTLQTERVTPQLGGQLIDATIDRFFISEIFKDRYVVYITLEIPYALNNVEIHLVV